MVLNHMIIILKETKKSYNDDFMIRCNNKPDGLPLSRGKVVEAVFVAVIKAKVTNRS